MNNNKLPQTELNGTAVSSGIAIGRVYLLERGKVHVAKHQIREEQVEKELSKFRGAVKGAIEDLSRDQGFHPR